MSKDVCLQENVGFEESVENLNLIKEFCEKYIRPFCFNFEDFLYSPMAMKINKLAFIAELFWYFELEPNREFVPNNHVELFRDYIKSNSTSSLFSCFYTIIIVFLSLEYTKRHFHATTPFLSNRIGDVTRNSFIKKGPYAATVSQQSESDNNESNQRHQTDTNQYVNLITKI